MKLFIFTIYDTKAEAYLPPFFLPSEAQAVRTFGDCCADDNHQFGKHPEDYTLCNVGSFEDSNALITVYNPKISLITGLESKTATGQEAVFNRPHKTHKPEDVEENTFTKKQVI